jgi:hypothetical protein
MEAPARNRLIVAGVVLVVAAAISAAASGVISAITFVIAVIALLVGLAVLGAAVFRLVRAGLAGCRLTAMSVSFTAAGVPRGAARRRRLGKWQVAILRAEGNRPQLRVVRDD